MDIITCTSNVPRLLAMQAFIISETTWSWNSMTKRQADTNYTCSTTTPAGWHQPKAYTCSTTTPAGWHQSEAHTCSTTKRRVDSILKHTIVPRLHVRLELVWSIHLLNGYADYHASSLRILPVLPKSPSISTQYFPLSSPNSSSQFSHFIHMWQK